MAVDVKLRFNADAGEVELVYGESVALSSGKDVFESWAKYWAEQNNYVPKPEEPVTPEPVVEPPAPEPPAPAPTPEPVVETPAEGESA